MINMLNQFFEQISSVTFWIEIVEGFRGYGLIAPIFLTMIESLIPALPLVAIVTFNIGVYGILLGFICSWLGSVIGSIIVFLFFRYVIKKHLFHLVRNRKTIIKGLHFVDNANIKLLFLVSIFPFTPSSLLNVCFGLSDFNAKDYIMTMASAKLIMIFFLTLFGNSFVMAFENPIFFVLSILLLIILSLVSRYFSRKNDL